jgi:16S rRNA (cytosine1402-N4)-methyltransferase
MDNPGHHAPVLLDEVADRLAPLAGARLLDATFGGGGYARRWLADGARAVAGLDRDPAAVARGRALAAQDPRFTMYEGRFGDVATLVDGPFDGIAFDLGVSSFQLDAAERGFSFRVDGPLDMRMGGDGATAADLVAELDERELARLFRDYGEERRARRVAQRICARRRERPFTRTGDLADVVRAAVGPSGDLDPATRVFQALRIAVNDELGEIERALDGAVGLLAPGGRLVVVAFHSLEDRLVKRFFQREAGRLPGPSRHQPAVATAPARLELSTRKVVRPGDDEIARNPRARSARLRAARRLEG